MPVNLEFNDIIDWLEYVNQNEILVPAEVEYPQFFINLEIKNQVSVDSDELLIAMHHRLKGQIIENSVWDQTLWHYPRQTPDEICFYLIENELALSTLGHTRQSDKVLWVLGHLVPEAALTLGKDIYLSDNYSLNDFKKLLQEYYDLHWLWQSLAYHTPSHPSKETYFRSELDKRPDFTEVKDKIIELETIDLLKATNSVELITKYYNQGVPKYLHCISANPCTPLVFLEQMSTLKDIKYAKQIRNQSRENWFQRTGKPLSV